MNEYGNGNTAPSGAAQMTLVKPLGGLRERKQPTLAWKLKNFVRYQLRALPSLAFYRFLGSLFSLVYIESALRLRVLHADGTFTDYGVVSRRVMTTAGANAISGGFQGTFTLANFKYHGFGTGVVAEAVGDVGLGTEMTTQYVVDNTRPTGSQAAGGSANIYRTIATFSPDSGGTIAITEHGIFSAVSGVTLLDRSVFAAVNLVAGSDSLQTTYDLTITAGG